MVSKQHQWFASRLFAVKEIAIIIGCIVLLQWFFRTWILLVPKKSNRYPFSRHPLEKQSLTKEKINSGNCLLHHLELARFNHLAIPVQQAVQIHAAVKILQVNGGAGKQVAAFKHFFAGKIEHLQAVAAVVRTVKFKSDKSSCGVGVGTNDLILLILRGLCIGIQRGGQRE